MVHRQHSSRRLVNNEWSGGVCIFESDDFVLRGRPDLTEYVKPNAGFTIRVVPPDHSLLTQAA